MTLRSSFLQPRGLVGAAGQGVGVRQAVSAASQPAPPSGGDEAFTPLHAALQALALAAEAQHDGQLHAAIHTVEGDGLRVRACGSVPPALCAAIDALADAHSPARRALRVGAPLALDLTRAGAATDWPAGSELLRRHGFAGCCALPLSDGVGRPLAVWMLYGRAALPVVGETLASLSRPVALLIEQALHQRQRDHEAQVRRDTLRALAHDMRNLLAPLRTALEVLSRPGVEGGAPQRLQAIMGRQLAQLAALPDELSRLARTPEDDAAADGAQLPLPADGLSPPAPVQPRVAVAPDAAHAVSSASGEDGHPSEGTAVRPAPVGAASAPPGMRAAPVAPGGDDASLPRRVLVADDNELVRDSFVELLAAEGFEVRTAADGVQAVEIADQWRPDVVLLDIHMPRLSGLETARRLRAAHPPQAMTLLMLSGMALNDAWVRHAKAAGFDDCLDKSDDPRAWLARLRSRSAPH